MPLGLCNAPATFEGMMDTLLQGLKWTICLGYLDDVIIFAPTFETHLECLMTVLAVFQDEKLQLNSSKCHFGCRGMTVLGHLVNANGIQPDSAKVRVVQDFPVPCSVKPVSSLIGLCSYFHHFVPYFADIDRPLTELLKNNVTFTWGQRQAEAFTALTKLLTSFPILAHFDPSAPTEISTDGSGHGIGAVLAQIQRGQECVIAYASSLLSTAERNYAITE